MLAKVLTATLTAVLAYMAVRQLKQHADKAKERVRADQKQRREKIVTLREDPETGIFRPSDRD